MVPAAAGRTAPTKTRSFTSVAAGSRGERSWPTSVNGRSAPSPSRTPIPFDKSGWVFAHNGTIEDLGWLSGELSPERLAARREQTDSEVLFAFLLTRLDEKGPHRSSEPATPRITDARARPP